MTHEPAGPQQTTGYVETAVEAMHRAAQGEPPPDAGMEALERLRVAAQAYSRPYRNESADCDAELIRAALAGRAAPSSDALREALGWLEERTRLDRFGEPDEIRAAVMAVLVASLAGRAAPVEGGICKTHGLAVLMTHVNDGEPCSDFLATTRAATPQYPRAKCLCVGPSHRLDCPSRAAPVGEKADSNPFSEFIEALSHDREMQWGYHCNIAMAMVDEGVDHAVANRGADRFLTMLLGAYEPLHDVLTATHAATPPAEGVERTHDSSGQAVSPNWLQGRLMVVCDRCGSKRCRRAGDPLASCEVVDV